jgi:hypothetical protein
MSKANEGGANIRMPIGRMSAYKKMIGTLELQLEVIQSNPDYPNHPDLQAAATKLQAELDDLKATVQELSNLEALARGLRVQRSSQTASAKRGHDLVVSLLNTICKGDKAAMATWGGRPATRVPADPTVAAPEDVTVAYPELGAAVMKCASDRTALCYLFQIGTTLSDPESWPPPIIESGCKHRIADQPPGTRLYFRVAIQRRRTGQGHWSDVREVVVR